MIRFTLLNILLLLCITGLLAQPSINTVNPLQGPAGSNVQIGGLGFDVNPANNIVYFGGVRATITAATVNTLSVTVPYGATYKSISVTVNSLTAFSAKPFVTSFSSFTTFATTSFDPRQDVASGDYPESISAADLDGDGKADIASTNSYLSSTTSTISIFRNTSVPGTITMAAPVIMPTVPSNFFEKLLDIDGDGKLDLIIDDYTNSKMVVYRNTSSPGNIQFATPLSFVVGLNPNGFDIADFNNDGHPDIMTVNQNANTISILKNTSSPGNISFAAKIDFITGQRPVAGCASDLDNDGKPDIAVANMNDNTVSVFKNTSTGTVISFAAKVDLPVGVVPFNVTAADIDGDNKTDLLIPNSSGASFSILKNNGSPGTIAFNPKMDYTTPNTPLHISVGDMNGDGKADVVVTCFSAHALAVFKNSSTPGNISLDPAFSYTTPGISRASVLVDFDNDGRTDMACTNSIPNNISIFRNAVQVYSCPGAINTFPYNEKFETSNGNWLAGGTSSDWAWGTPSKPVINVAGEGSKCWTIGGLNNASYNNGERSWLQSPCFDFTTLVHPQISFKVFWETEKDFDGGSLQYSIDNGASWLYLGAANADDGCATQNWFNNSNITYLSGNGGWSGNKQTNGGSCQVGNGSNTWLLAKHDMTLLAGKPSVLFRFEFGAGTTCNSFDGFAIDDVKIYEAVPNVAEFNYTCKPALTIDFTSGAVCATSESWNFGDIASGSNTSTLPNPSHIFSAPGTYTISHQALFPINTSTITKQVTVLSTSISLDQPITCSGSANATLTAAVAGSLNPYTYTWNTNPVQSTATISGLPAGLYSVTVNSGTACPAQSTITVTEPAPLTIMGTSTDAICLSANGTAIANVTGGISPYTYLWSNSSVNSSLSNLSAGNYHVDVKDVNGCIAAKDFTVNTNQKKLLVDLGADTYICPGQQLTLNAGNYPSYLWQDNSTKATFDVTQTGTYSVKVEDVDGCTGTDAIKVVVDCSDIYFPNAFTPNGDGKNETYGPVGTNLAALKEYSFSLYNRYGEQIFHNNDPYIKWDGKYKGEMIGNQAFFWISTYKLNGNTFFKKGTVMLIR